MTVNNITFRISHFPQWNEGSWDPFMKIGDPTAMLLGWIIIIPFRFVRNFSGKWPVSHKFWRWITSKVLWCWRGEYPSEMVLFQHDGMTSCGFWCPKEMKQQKTVLCHDHLSVGSSCEFWVFGCLHMCVMSLFFWYLLFLPGKKSLGNFLGPTQWSQTSFFVGKVGNFFVNAKRPDEIKRWQTGIHTGPGWQKVSHTRLNMANGWVTL